MELMNARGRRESGQMLILFVLMLGVLMGFMAMSIDVGMILHERRSLQNAADAAALAGVPELPEFPGAAEAKALEWAEKNGYTAENGATITVNTPYQGNPGAIEVIIERDQPFIFARVLAMDSIGVNARAVASRDGGGGYGPAIFAFNSGCDAPTEIDMSGAIINIVGDVISNGQVKMTSSDVEVEGALTYRCEDPLLQNGTFSGGLNQVDVPVDWSAWFVYADFACDFTSSDPGTLWKIDGNSAELWLNDDPSTGVLKPGVYCHSRDIQVSGGASGKVTFASLAGVTFSGGPYGLTPYQDNVLVFALKQSTYIPCKGGPKCPDDSAVHISSNSFTWEGIFFVPNGMIQFSGSTIDSPSGGVWGHTVKMSSSSGSITGLSEFGGGLGAVKLVE